MGPSQPSLPILFRPTDTMPYPLLTYVSVVQPSWLQLIHKKILGIF